MDEEIEDLVGDVKYTASQKSVAASNGYSMDFTDSSSDKNNSSGKETYVIEWYDSEDSEKMELHDTQSIINLNDVHHTPLLVKYNNSNIINQTSKTNSTNFHKCSIVQEIFTQTSKTIFELAESERYVMKSIENKTLETQTSFISVTENTTVEYRKRVSEAQTRLVNHTENDCLNKIPTYHINTTSKLACTSLDDHSSKFLVSESETERTDDCKSETSDINKPVNLMSEEESNDEKKDGVQIESVLDISSHSDTDIDEDSLMCNEFKENKSYNADNVSDTSEIPKSIDSEVEDLYNKLSEKIVVKVEKPYDLEMQRVNTLSPLTEESTVKKQSFLDITSNFNNIINDRQEDKYFLFVNNSGIKIKIFPDDEISDFKDNENENFKLPPIKNNMSGPSSPHLNFLFGNVNRTANQTQQSKRECFTGDRWEIGTKDLAAGESPLITGRSDPAAKLNHQFQLPPIHTDGNIRCTSNDMKLVSHEQNSQLSSKKDVNTKLKAQFSINIQDKITELKINNNSKWSPPKYNVITAGSKSSRSASPESRSPENSRLGDVAERGCDALSVELLKRLRSPSWFEVSDTLEELPKVMSKFWGVVSENRIADMIRQDFFEAVTCLLVKTGSYSRPVRRAANMALDDVVCGVDLTHSVTALCVHGAGHKSPLVRCAAARLLVVCCALGGGGRELLRTRPPSAVCARRQALRALAALLEDKNTETRKYAERLYSMLRPLSNFEAFYLTDLDVDVAARQMKKYDRLLLCGPPADTR